MPFEELHNEQRLLSKVAQGDRKAFSHFYKHYYPRVQQYLSLFLRSGDQIEELTQDIFLKIWLKREVLTKINNFEGYLFRTCKNFVLNYFRSVKMGRTFVELAVAEQMGSSEDTESEVLFRQYYQIASEAIGKLSGGRRRILLMSIEEGLTLDEIAAKLEITRAGVKKQLYGAMGFVRKYVREHAGISLLLFAFLSLFEI